MKKNLLLLILCCLFVSGCGNKVKEVKDFTDFEQVTINNGFTVSDNMNSYNGVTYIEGSKLAIVDGVSVEMVIYDSVDNAKKAQDMQIDSFNNLKNTGASLDRESGKNYYKYSLISNGYYMVSSRIDNTLVFSKVVLEDKDKIEDILEDMGY